MVGTSEQYNRIFMETHALTQENPQFWQFNWSVDGSFADSGFAPEITAEMDRRVEELLAMLDLGVYGDTFIENAGVWAEPLAPVTMVEPTVFAAPADNTSYFLPEEIAARPRKKARRATDIALWAAILCILIATVVFNINSTDGFQIFGYSAFTEQGGDTRGEIPDGALVLTRITPSDEIALHDDITFTTTDNSIVTRRVTKIVENPGNGAGRGFLTWDTEKSMADGDVVGEENVLGVVKNVIPGLGAVLTYISDNIVLLLLTVVLLLLIFHLIFLLRLVKGGRSA